MTLCCNGGASGKAVYDICKMCHYWMPLAIVYPQTGAQQIIKRAIYCSQKLFYPSLSSDKEMFYSLQECSELSAPSVLLLNII